MFHTPIESSLRISPSIDSLMAFVGRPLPSRFDIDLCTDQVRTTDCDALRFASEARKSSSVHAFRPAFDDVDWRILGSFCVARRLPADHRLLVPGRTDRTLRFVVEGGFWQACEAGGQPTLLPPGSILGEDTLFSDAAGELDVRTLEDSLVLELSLQRQKELTASRPEIGFELLRAAGAVIAARNRPAAAN